MKKLPSIYKNTNTMKDHNNKMCYVNNNKETINDILNNIFSGYHIPYHIKVQITTKSKVFNTYLTLSPKNSESHFPIQFANIAGSSSK